MILWDWDGHAANAGMYSTLPLYTHAAEETSLEQEALSQTLGLAWPQCTYIKRFVSFYTTNCRIRFDISLYCSS